MVSVTVHREPLSDFLTRRHQMGAGNRPTDTPAGICLMSGAIVQRNLRRQLTKRDVPASSIAEYMTLEQLSHHLLEVTYDERIVELDDSFRQRLIRSILDEAATEQHDEPLETFAKNVAWHEDETLEQIDSEFSDYLRCTDTTNSHGELVALAEDSDNVFVRREMPRRLEAFHQLAQELTERVDEASVRIYPTRSHAVTAAKEALTEGWTEAFGNRSWLAVSTLNVVDNTTLQFVLEIAAHPEAPDVHFFFGDGTYDRQVSRLEACELVTDVEKPDKQRTPQSYLDSTAAETLFDAVRGDSFIYPDNMLDLASAPERRREVEYVVQQIREDLEDGINPSDIIVVARDVGTYQSIIKDIFETNEIPYHIETPLPYAHLPAYRFLNALLDLLVAIENGTEITYDTLTDPLRLGFCPPHIQSEYWPLSDRVFLYLEQRLHDHQERMEGQKKQFDEWLAVIDQMSGWNLAWNQMETYLEWVKDQRGTPPEEGTDLRELLRSLLQSYIYHRIPDQRGIPEGPGVNSTRTGITQSHPTRTGRQVLAQSDAVGRHYDFARVLLNAPVSWEQVQRAVGEVIGSGRYGAPDNDGNAIRITDFGQTYYRSARRTYFIGMEAGQVPVEPEQKPFIHNSFRSEVSRASKSGDAPLLHFDSRDSQHEVDVDLYETALRASERKVTLVRRYKTSDRNQLEWSPFVDLLPTEKKATRIRADQWLPVPDDGQEWEDTARQVSPKDRIRLLYHHARREFPRRRPAIERSDVVDIARYTPEKPVVDHIIPRYDRYTNPPVEIEVSPDEPAFDEGLSLSEITGEPIRPHEMDLLNECELKYYFYQFLFNHTGQSIERDDIPFYSSRRPHYRFGRLPQIIRHHYPEANYKDQWKELITEHFPDRQAGLGAFSSLEELRDWFDGQDYNDWHESVLLPVLEDEWQLVQQELEAGITREWSWQRGREITVERDDEVTYTLLQPSHRRDILPDDDQYQLPVYFVRNTSYAKKASKACWKYNGENRNIRSPHICRTCNKNSDCSYTTKFTTDTRLLSTILEDSDIAGVQYQERFDSANRRGHIKENHVDAIRSGISNGPEAAFGNDKTKGWAWHAYWRPQATDEITEKLQDLGDTSEHEAISFDVEAWTIDEGVCESCVYRTMCMVPQANGGDI